MKQFSAVLFTTMLCFASIIAQSTALADDRSLTILQDTDLPGGDYQTDKRVTLDQCKQACLSDNRCAAFTFNSKAKWCFLKAAAGAPSSYKGAVSGTIGGAESGAVVAAQPTTTSSAEPSASAAPSPEAIKLAQMYQAAILYCAKDKHFHLRDASYQGPALFADPWACQDGIVVGCQTFTQHPFVCLVWAPLLLPDDAAAVASIMKAQGLSVVDATPAKAHKPITNFDYKCYDNEVQISAAIADEDINQFVDPSIAFAILRPILASGDKLCDAALSKQEGFAVSRAGQRDLEFNLNDNCLTGFLMLSRNDVEYSRNCAAERIAAIATADENARIASVREKWSSDNAVGVWVSASDLIANPFRFQDKVVGLGTTTFVRMVGQDEAVFGNNNPLIIRGVPSTLFAGGEKVVLALRVHGVRQLNGNPIPDLEFITDFQCTTNDCTDFFGK